MATESGWRLLLAKLLALLPERLQMLLRPAKYGFPASAVPDPVQPPSSAIRLYIAPVNSAAQGYRWARAAELLSGVSAVDMQHRGAADYGFPADYALPTEVFLRSDRWQRRQFRAVSRGFTHVLIESQRPIFARLFDHSVEREVAALRAAGLKVGMLCHGSDIRLPSRHAAWEPWSPFAAAEWELTAVLEDRARKAHEILRAADAPVFVSTPDLLMDWPAAQWLPVVVDPARWRCGTRPLDARVPVVLHVPSNPVVKGTALIEPAVRRLVEEGLLDYRQVQGVPADDMPALYASADIVLEQFRMGNYSVTAVEAMAAGRLVLGHVHDQVRDHVRATHGLELPVLEATPDTLESVLRAVLADRERYQASAAAGPAFVDAVHDGRASAAVLEGFLRE
ncbi:MAG: glycosyltransferase family protein [Marmoricola sp.]